MRELKRLVAKAGQKINTGSAINNIQGTIIVGLVSFIPSVALVENLPMDNSDKLGSEVAIAEYNDALNILSRYNADQGIESAPSSLDMLLASNPYDNIELYEHTQNVVDFRTLSQQFGVSSIIDKRINEKQKYDLTQLFESKVGDFEELTGLDKPDFADLDEATSRLLPNENERAFAEEVSQLSHKVNRQGELGALQLSFAFLWFVLSFSALTYPAQFQQWKNEPKYKKPPKYRH